MKILLTGTAGHLGEALARTLADAHDVVGLDVQPSPYTRVVGSIADADVVRRAMTGIEAVLHTATLHKPHVVTHSRREFVDTNIVGTLNLLEEARAAGVRAFVYTSTTSVFGQALRPNSSLASAWVTEDLVPVPRNIYGVTKNAAEDLCELFHRTFQLPCIVLRTSRFFPDKDDDAAVRAEFDDDNVKINEYLYRRVDLADVVEAHLCALERAPEIKFGRYIVSATTPFEPDDAAELRTNAPAVVRRLFPDYERVYAQRGWKMFGSIDRVYVNHKARDELGWRPRYDFASALDALRTGRDFKSPLAREVGFKGYHAGKYAAEMYPT